MDSKNREFQEGEETCRTCKHYDYFGDREQDAEGQCHRHAPSPEILAKKPTNEMHYADWPFVRAHDFCGEWQRSPEMDEDA